MRVCWAILCSAVWLHAQPVNFSREILPVISEKCLSCHGGDTQSRMAGLRLDTREGALELRRGKAAVVPGNPEDSLLLQRVAPANPNNIMPPERSHKGPLTADQVTTFRRWIEQGAPWGRHWSFEKPERSELPAVSRNPVDAFVLDKLAKAGLKPATEASRETLIRRVSFDLTGLPPTPEETAAFVSDKSPDAWRKLIARLLASEHFGERMAMWWLDAAHYADTDGFQADATRTNWPWRDWVVSAFNRNQRFDQFTVEQFAGDLLPNATEEQKLATSFFRSHMTNGEGGRDPEESRIDYVLDRVNTTGTVWLGLTVGCAQCHTHKFDPITHNDYYSLSGFFNSIDEDGNAGTKAKPYMKYKSPYAVRAVLEAQQLVDARKPAEAKARNAAEKPFEEWLLVQTKAVRGGFSAWHPLRAAALESSEDTKLAQEADGTIQTSGPNPRQDDYRVIAPIRLQRVTGIKLEVFPHASNSEGRLSRGASGEFLLTDIKVQVRRRGNSQVRDILVRGALADYIADKKKNNNYGDIADTLDDDPRNGWTTLGADPRQPHTGLYALAEPLTLGADEELIFEMRHRSTTGDANIGRFRVSVTDQPGPAVESLEAAPLEQLSRQGISDELRGRLMEQFLTGYSPYLAAKEELDRAKRQLQEMKGGDSVNVMVLADRPAPRETNILLRGVWDKKGDKVEPGIIPAIAPWPAPEHNDDVRNRLGLAHWITSRQNPLTARVIVNHLWQLMYGNGLVRTPDDFGLQGEQPTHPELLDWLAVEFMDSGWDVKHMLTLMADSATYRQSSVLSAGLAARDPQNLLLARGPRFRLSSWMLRDAALSYAGLLNPELGGPPVKPYQPDGVWEELFMGRFKYEPSEGVAQYRRTLYAFWRRSIAPTFLFDTAQRRSCEVRISRTNTPLQALTLMNDETYLEASRVLAEHAVGDPVRIFERVTGRKPDASEAGTLRREYEKAVAVYRAQPAEIAKLIRVGHPTAELAATMITASMILNLDEAVTHE